MHEHATQFSLTPEDIENAVRFWMACKGYKDVDKVYFFVEGVEDPNDAFAQMPLDHVLSGATVVMKERTDND
jgi:hypothetical protein